MNSSTDVTNGAADDLSPSFSDALKVWLKTGLMSFGGPAAQIMLMMRLVVTDRKWMTEKQFLDSVSFCMLLPGPEAMQLATYMGWRLHGIRGGLAAGLLFVIPGALIVLAFAVVYGFYGDVPLVTSLFLGIKAAVIVVVIEALLRVSKKALVGIQHWVIAGLAFVGIFFLQLPFPLIVLIAAVYGFFRISDKTEATANSAQIRQWRVMLKQSMRTIVLWLLIWWVPVLLVLIFSDHQILAQTGFFFSKLAVVTFGGAYAVLAYLGQEVVSMHQWLTAGEMMDGLGLAETTPGPLILVTEFVGYLAAFRAGGVWLGLAGALMTLWVTFVPCFLWIFVGAPYIEWIIEQPKLRGALSAITAAVVGVILNLTLWFGMHVFFREVTLSKGKIFSLWVPDWSSLDWRVVVLTVLCAVLAFRFHKGIMTILGISAILGFALSQLFP